MYDSFVDLLVRMRCTQEPAGLTPGRPDEGVWAYASNARPPRRGHLHAKTGLDGGPRRLGLRVQRAPQSNLRRGDGVNLQLKLEESGEETSNLKRAES